MQLNGYLSEEMNKKKHSAYHDRMQQWDYEKFKEACRALSPGSFSKQSVENLEKFLSIYTGKSVRLLGLIEGCNVSNAVQIS